MNWEVATAIAEITGAIAVIVTLAYLAIQTRQSRIAVEQTADTAKLQATLSVVEVYSRWRILMASNPDVVNAIAKANNGEDLTCVEKTQISAAFEERIVASWMSFASSFGSGSLHSTSADVEYLVQYFRDNPAAVEHWNKMRMVIELSFPEFASAVDAKLGSISSSA